MSDVRATTALTETLADINRWYPATAQPPREAVAQTRTAHASKPPLPADVLSVRRETVDLLASWAEVVIDGRNLHPNIQAGDVPALTSFLGAHAEWLVEQDGKAILYELGQVATALEQIVKQSRPSRVKVGPCPERCEDGTACPGVMTATVRKSDDLLPSSVRCSVERTHSFEPHDWPALGRRMGVIPYRDAG